PRPRSGHWPPTASPAFRHGNPARRRETAHGVLKTIPREARAPAKRPRTLPLRGSREGREHHMDDEPQGAVTDRTGAVAPGSGPATDSGPGAGSTTDSGSAASEARTDSASPRDRSPAPATADRGGSADQEAGTNPTTTAARRRRRRGSRGRGRGGSGRPAAS